jgi:serine/threonine protein kinase
MIDGGPNEFSNSHLLGSASQSLGSMDRSNEGSSNSGPSTSFDVFFEKGSVSANSFSSNNFSKSYLYIVTELCREESLKNWLDNNILLDHSKRRQEALTIFTQICQAVDYIHSKEIFHR